MQDIGIPPFESSLEFSTMIEDSCGKLKKNSSEVRDCRKLRGRDSKLRSRFSIEQEFCNTRIDNEDLWDGNVSTFTLLVIKISPLSLSQ